MANSIHGDIVSAEGQIFSGEASMVFVPGSQGELGIAPRHAPLLTTLKPGVVRVQTEGAEEQSFYVGGGAPTRGFWPRRKPSSPVPWHNCRPSSVCARSARDLPHRESSWNCRSSFWQ